MNDLGDAQRDMRVAYYGGATGAAASATAWLVAGVVATIESPVAGIVALIFGGMLIFPLSVLLSKLAGRSGSYQKGNPLAPLAISGTIWMLLSIPIAVAVSLYRIEWFFPAMLLVIGGRYLTFGTLYGDRVYWLFGGALGIAAVLLAVLEAPVYAGAFAGALIEYAFAAVLFIRSKAPED